MPLNRNLATVSRLARRELEGFWRTLDHSNMVRARQALEEFFPVLVSQYGNVAAVVAADWYEDLYSEYADMASDQVIPNKVNSRMGWAIGKAFDGNPGQAVSTLGVVTDELVKQFGRDTVIGSAAKNGRRYARVPQSDTCTWCLMLASRGFVYRSERSAGKMHKFHGDCDCDVVPDDGEIPEGYDPDDLYEKYLNAHDPGDTDRQTAAKLRQQLDLSH